MIENPLYTMALMHSLPIYNLHDIGKFWFSSWLIIDLMLETNSEWLIQNFSMWAEFIAIYFPWETKI